MSVVKKTTYSMTKFIAFNFLVLFGMLSYSYASVCSGYLGQNFYDAISGKDSQPRKLLRRALPLLDKEIRQQLQNSGVNQQRISKQTVNSAYQNWKVSRTDTDMVQLLLALEPTLNLAVGNYAHRLSADQFQEIKSRLTLNLVELLTHSRIMFMSDKREFSDRIIDNIFTPSAEQWLVQRAGVYLEALDVFAADWSGDVENRIFHKLLTQGITLSDVAVIAATEGIGFEEALRVLKKGLVDYQVSEAALVELPIAEDSYDSPEYSYSIKDMIDRFAQTLLTLPPREERVIRLRYGFEGKPMTLDEISILFNRSRERIRSIEKGAEQKLKHPSRNRPLAGIARNPRDYRLNKIATFAVMSPEFAKTVAYSMMNDRIRLNKLSPQGKAAVTQVLNRLDREININKIYKDNGINELFLKVLAKIEKPVRSTDFLIRDLLPRGRKPSQLPISKLILTKILDLDFDSFKDEIRSVRELINEYENSSEPVSEGEKKLAGIRAQLQTMLIKYGSLFKGFVLAADVESKMQLDDSNSLNDELANEDLILSQTEKRFAAVLSVYSSQDLISEELKVELSTWAMNKPIAPVDAAPLVESRSSSDADIETVDQSLEQTPSGVNTQSDQSTNESPSDPINGSIKENFLNNFMVIQGITPEIQNVLDFAHGHLASYERKPTKPMEYAVSALVKFDSKFQKSVNGFKGLNPLIASYEDLRTADRRVHPNEYLEKERAIVQYFNRWLAQDWEKMLAYSQLLADIRIDLESLNVDDPKLDEKSTALILSHLFKIPGFSNFLIKLTTPAVPENRIRRSRNFGFWGDVI